VDASTLWLPGAFVGLFVLWFVVAAGGFAVWLWGLIDAARRPDWAYRWSGSDKTLWVVLIAVLGFIPAIIYLVGIRPKVQAAELGAGPAGCPRCGSALHAGAAFCARCGLRVAGPTGAAPG
jgi:hypothetical protein